MTETPREPGPYELSERVDQELYAEAMAKSSDEALREEIVEITTHPDVPRNTAFFAPLHTDYQETPQDPFMFDPEKFVPDIVPAEEHVERVNHPSHYLNRNASIVLDEHETFVAPDGTVMRPVECIELMRRIKDPRIAHAWAYIWRIAFGGKDSDAEDAKKAAWFLTDFAEKKIVPVGL